jgi:hypothetical protein
MKDGDGQIRGQPSPMRPLHARVKNGQQYDKNVLNNTHVPLKVTLSVLLTEDETQSTLVMPRVVGQFQHPRYK